MSHKFGENFEEYWPVSAPELSEIAKKLLTQCTNIKKPQSLDLQELIKNSNEFPVKFPINSCRIVSQPKNRWTNIEDQAASVYPIIYERVIWLYLRFLEHKLQYGTNTEKRLYANMNLQDFVQRLLSKRCVSFFAKNDKYLLLSGERGASGFVGIGTDQETPPLILSNCLSYDEIKLSALLSVSSHSEFLNDGSRTNCGKIESNKNLIQTSGIIIGIIGARLSRRDLMEFQDIVISKTQNITENGYGSKKPAINSNEIDRKFDYRQMWNTFYDEKGTLFVNTKKDGKRYGDSKNAKDIFDNLVMKKRYTISFDTLLLESEARAVASGKKAYLHVVGIGLGVWRTAKQQEEIFLETFSQRLKFLLPNLNHISFVHFSWFNLTDCGGIKNGNLLKSDNHPDGGIRIFISKRNPADKLQSPEFDNTLLIVSYAWDGNALPGNEFWMGLLKSTGDSSTACSTLISELHNPHINSTMVSGENLHVASTDFGVLHIAEYANKILS